MLSWADQFVFDEGDWRQTCAFACSSCLCDFSSCDVEEFNLASLVLSSVRKLWNKRFKHVSWSLREQVKNFRQHIYKSCRNLVFVFQLLAAFLSPRKLLSKTAKFSLVFFILQQKKRSKMGQKQARKVQRGKKRQNWWWTALDQVVWSVPYFPIWPSVTNTRRQKEGQRATEKANSIVGREVWGACRLSGMHSVLEVCNGRMVYSVVLVCFQSAGNVKASKPLSR